MPGPELPNPETRELRWNAGARAERTRARILEAAKQVFLEHGFRNVRVQDIAEAANLSRASFYVYFPSKRDVFLAVGILSAERSEDVIKAIEEIPSDWTLEHIEKWVGAFVDFYEDFGAFVHVWREAAWIDEELRSLGAASELRFGRRLGQQLDRLRGASAGITELEGLGVEQLIEGLWHFWRVYHTPYLREEVIQNLARMIAAMLRPDA